MSEILNPAARSSHSIGRAGDAGIVLEGKSVQATPGSAISPVAGQRGVEARRLPEINGLRGIAILMVLFLHLYRDLLFQRSTDQPIIWVGGLSSIGWWAASPLRHCWSGVNFFFVLSGFVLFKPYVTGSRQLSSWPDWFDYYRRRAWRLIPLLFISTCFFLALSYPSRGGKDLVVQLGQVLTGVFVFSKKSFFPPVNGVLWSLGVELWFSAVFPIVALFLLRPKPLRAILVFYGIALATRIWGTQLFLTDWISLLNPVKDGLAGRIDDFVAGMAVCLFYYRAKDFDSHGLSLAGIAGLLAVAGGFILDDAARAGLLPGWLMAVSYIPINAGFACLLLYAIASPGSLWARLLRFDTLQAAGVMCYSIYVWHSNIQNHMVFDAMNYSQAAFYVMLLGIIATMSWLLIECAEPGAIQKRLRKLTA